MHMSSRSSDSPGSDARAVADAAVAQWRAIHAALSPVIGTRGVAALYKRSLHLALPAHPWLASAYRGPLGTSEFDSLHAALMQQTPAGAAEGSQTVLRTFRELLSSLIGEALVQQLLPFLQSPPSGGGSAAANDDAS
jgi:hypothetical protein